MDIQTKRRLAAMDCFLVVLALFSLLFRFLDEKDRSEIVYEAIVPESESQRWTLGKPIRLNSASEQELELLPGIGPSRAQSIIDARRRKGEFTAVDELLEIRGIGPATLEKLKSQVTLDETPDTAPVRIRIVSGE